MQSIHRSGYRPARRAPAGASPGGRFRGQGIQFRSSLNFFAAVVTAFFAAICTNLVRAVASIMASTCNAAWLVCVAAYNSTMLA